MKILCLIARSLSAARRMYQQNLADNPPDVPGSSAALLNVLLSSPTLSISSSPILRRSAVGSISVFGHLTVGFADFFENQFSKCFFFSYNFSSRKTSKVEYKVVCDSQIVSAFQKDLKNWINPSFGFKLNYIIIYYSVNNIHTFL